VERKNREVEQAKLALEDKATQLTLSSKYKSEFLANMSHELRTPLNSLLILAQQLSDNPEHNLSDRQVEFAKTIYGSGSDLLTLINDILDLSKIESGTVTLEVSEYRFEMLRAYVERTFHHMAEVKKINFSVELDGDLPPAMRTDTTRLQQILKNLLSNAFKFTANGCVSLRIGLAKSGWTADHLSLSHADVVIAFSVADTGVGIPADKLQLIFEAFQQADGSTARKYGGTGLGLSISRELARLLRGEIRVESELGVGSTFTLYLPYHEEGIDHYDHPQPAAETPAVKLHRPSEPVFAQESNPESQAQVVTVDADAAAILEEDAPTDDRAFVAPGEPAVLIVEDDEETAQTLLDHAREQNFKGIVTLQANSALALTRDYLPTAILLDLDHADVDGFTVLERLKRDPGTRHIPVHVLSKQADRERALRHGAISYSQKPVSLARLQDELERIQQYVTSGKRHLLVVEDDPAQRDAVVSLIGDTDVHIEAVGNGEEALRHLKRTRFDCMVLDLMLPDMSGFDLLDAIAADTALRDLPIIIYTAAELDRDAVKKLQGIAKTIVVKDARSPERLVAETALFLHRAHADLPEQQRRMLDDISAADVSLVGRKVLVVDDDLRNIFALSSVLERQGMKVLYAENGRDGIEVLQSDPDIEIVLMDIMMPEMDGYD
ncbi:MAG: ATP-binding response regulator, partial [Noviherbaspirillum sp.]